MKILVIGNATYDVTFPVEQFPEENTKVRANFKVDCGGGPAYNAAYLLGKWGMDTTFAGLVGNDSDGIKIVEQLESVGIRTDYVQKSDQFSTTTAFIIANITDGTRTVITHKPSSMKMDDFEIDFEPDVILVDGQEYDLSVKFIQKYPDAISIIDAGRAKKHIIELAKMVDYVVCSQNFAEEVTNIKIKTEADQINVYKILEDIFDGEVVITLEEDGALYKCEHQIKRMPSLKVKAMDSTGAGDIFHGAFTYAIANDYSIEQAVMIGNIAGAYSVTKISGLSSMPSKEVIRKYFNEFK